jgi:hypothetical protein
MGPLFGPKILKTAPPLASKIASKPLLLLG